MNPNERSILTNTCFGHFMCHFNMLVFPALVLPLTDRFGLELGQVLALSFWMYLLFGITALPWGILTDKLGARPLLFTFYGGAGLCGFGAAFLMDSPWAFSLCLAGVGLFSGIYHPAGLGLISRGVSRISVGMGYVGMAGNTGLAVAPILTGVINHLFGTPSTYVLLAGFNLTGVLIMLLSPSSEPSTKKMEDSKAPTKSLASGFAVLCLCMMLGGVAYRGATVILPSYFELRNPGFFEWLSRLDWLPVSRNVAATALTSAVFIVGILGQYMGGRVAERFEPRMGYLVFHALALPMALFMAYTTDLSLLLVAMAYMLFLLGMQPIENTLVAYLTPEKLRHSAYGTKFVLTFGVGALAVHLVGWIKEVWSLPAVFVAMAAVSVGIVLSILLLIYITRTIRFQK